MMILKYKVGDTVVKWDLSTSVSFIQDIFIVLESSMKPFMYLYLLRLPSLILVEAE